MIGNGAVEEEGVGIVDDLLKDEVFQLKTRSKGRIQSGIARGELGALGNGVVIGAPDELDGITDGCVDGEGDITKDALGWSNIDDVSLAGRGIVRRHRRGILGLTLLDTAVVGVVVTSPTVASRTIGGGRTGLVHGGRCTVWRRSTIWRGGAVGVGVGRRIGIMVAIVRIVIATIGIVVVAIRIIVATVAHAVTTIGRGRWR